MTDKFKFLYPVIVAKMGVILTGLALSGEGREWMSVAGLAVALGALAWLVVLVIRKPSKTEF